MYNSLKKINYFDLGLYTGTEVSMFINEVKGVYDYTVYGFEAHPELAESCELKFKHDPNVHIYNYAITDEVNAGKYINLYIASNNGLGNSIFSTKENVNVNDFVSVYSISFVNWVKQNVPDYETSYNILRFNIEGAELFLINDIIKNNFLNHINLYLGAKPGRDIQCVAELQHYYDDYMKLLSDKNIVIHPYCSDYGNRCISIRKELQKRS